MQFKPILIIPFYNHIDQFKAFFPYIKDLNIKILISNDGSNSSQTKELKSICKNNNFFYIEQSKNAGKGQALVQAFRWAFTHNFTHALQIDADGQHSTKDIPKFLDLSQKNPHSLICGIPLFDCSVPKHRKYGHKLTTFWTHVETLSTHKIQDALCGYRIYPLKPIFSILPSLKFMRMGFDIEILVKAYWNNIPIINVETKINYPDTGLSHFKLLRSNLEISLLHSYLCTISFYYNPKRIINSFFKPKLR